MRALAVVPVILNHAKMPFFSGGFIGVDIFFVISGFLISRIIFDEATAGKFSLINFYERRARRIIPALVPVILFSVVAGYFTMLPDPFENLSQSVVATLLFSNNVLLTLTSGYWELASDFKPLLHTWSLGVEEQFYVFYPLLVIAVLKLRRGLFPAFLIVGIVASLALSIVLTPLQPDASFYLIHTRAWELFLGAFASWAYSRHTVSGTAASALSLSGLVIILLSIVFLNEHTAYPSYWAALPCLGTVLILMYSRPGAIAHSVLCFSPFVLVGVISYSAYLWHQPLFAFARIMSMAPPAPWLMALLSVATLIVAYLSWRFVEQPFRNRAKFSRLSIFSLSAAASFALIALGGYIYVKSGLPERAEGMGIKPGSYIAYNEGAYQFKKDQFETADQPHLLVIGNSTGRDLVNLILESGRFKSFELVYRDDISLCDGAPLSPVAEALLANSDAIASASNWSFTQECPGIDVNAPRFHGVPVVLLGPKHFGYNLNAFLRTPPAERSAARANLLPDTGLSNAAFSKLVPSENYVDFLAIMDRKFGGTPIFDDKGHINSVDRVHLTQSGAKFFANIIFDDPAWAPIYDRAAAVAP